MVLSIFEFSKPTPFIFEVSKLVFFKLQFSKTVSDKSHSFSSHDSKLQEIKTDLERLQLLKVIDLKSN